MNIYLLRHGQTNENKKGFYHGSVDKDLNEEGKLQAKKAGEYIKDIQFDKIYVSERKRTFQTAEVALGNINDYIVDKRINETSFGIFEGMTYTEIQKKYPEECKKWDEDWVGYEPPEGESYLNMCSRVHSFMDDIKNTEYENILIVTHAGVMRAIYCYLMDKNIHMFWKFGCKNCDVALLKYEYGNLYLDSIVHCDNAHSNE